MQTWFDLEFFVNGLHHQMQAFIQGERAQQKSILPADADILNALTYTPFAAVKVVILGQDPYPNSEYAHGLSFSIPKTCHKIPRSLQNIFKELRSDVGITKMSGNLEGWARQGVLLLNSCLTVEEGKIGSHRGKGWERLVTEILIALNTQKKHLVFILWGKDAQKLAKKVDSVQHLKLASPHPSYANMYKEFWGSKPFSKTNAYLREHGMSEIDWNL